MKHILALGQAHFAVYLSTHLAVGGGEMKTYWLLRIPLLDTCPRWIPPYFCAIEYWPTQVLHRYLSKADGKEEKQPDSQSDPKPRKHALFLSALFPTIEILAKHHNRAGMILFVTDFLHHLMPRVLFLVELEGQKEQGWGR